MPSRELGQGLARRQRTHALTTRTPTEHTGLGMCQGPATLHMLMPPRAAWRQVARFRPSTFIPSTQAPPLTSPTPHAHLCKRAPGAFQAVQAKGHTRWVCKR